MRTPDDALLDPATRERIRADLAPMTITVFAGVTVVAALLTGVAHHELPFLAYAAGVCSTEAFVYECGRTPWDIAAGLLGFAAFGSFCTFFYRRRRIEPTVRCHSCGGLGWVMDLEPREGRCPRCAGSRFAYRTILGGALGDAPYLRPVEEPDVDGAALVERFRGTRRSLFDRYY